MMDKGQKRTQEYMKKRFKIDQSFEGRNRALTEKRNRERVELNRLIERESIKLQAKIDEYNSEIAELNKQLKVGKDKKALSKEIAKYKEKADKLNNETNKEITRVSGQIAKRDKYYKGEFTKLESAQRVAIEKLNRIYPEIKHDLIKKRGSSLPRQTEAKPRIVENVRDKKLKEYQKKKFELELEFKKRAGKLRKDRDRDIGAVDKIIEGINKRTQDETGHERFETRKIEVALRTAKKKDKLLAEIKSREKKISAIEAQAREKIKKREEEKAKLLEYYNSEESILNWKLQDELSALQKKYEEIISEEERVKLEEYAKEKKKKPRAVGRKALGVSRRAKDAVIVAVMTVASIPLVFLRLVFGTLFNTLRHFYSRAGGASPLGWKSHINEMVVYSAIDKTASEITGMTVVLSAVVVITMVGVCYFMLHLSLFLIVIAAFGSFAAVWVVSYSILDILVDKRTEEVESNLPDVLQIISANISSGMTPYSALWVAARPEFGALSEEIKKAQRETLGGRTFDEALSDIGNRLRSNVLRRTLRLLVQGMKSGGELPSILQGISTDIRQMQILQKEMAANVMSYTMFILFGILIGAPMLFSVSIQFVEVMGSVKPPSIDMSDATSSAPIPFGGSGFKMFTMSSASVSTEYLVTFAYAAIVIIAFFGALLVGLIRKGRQSAGIKLSPLLIAGAVGIFYAMNFGMSMFFGAMFVT